MGQKMHKRFLKQLEDSWYIRKPMQEFREDSAEYQWEQKKVLASRNLELFKNYDRIRFHGHGYLGHDAQVTKSGEGSVFIDFPTTDPVINPTGRAYSNAQMKLLLDREDLTEYNRISLWVYVDTPEAICSHLTLALHNEGPEIMPVPGRFEGSHSIMAPGGQWYKVLWEIPHVARNCVTGISITSIAYGTAFPAGNRIRIYFDNLQMEKVEVDYDKGFKLGQDRMAYCHSGYRSGSRKQAMVQQATDRFYLLDEEERIVYEGTPKPLQDFYILDFTEFETDGWYTIKAGTLHSKPFPIGKEAYLSAAWKMLNFFFVERCGCSVPGVHSACHMDVMSVHPDGRKKCVAGGWHDAGDLTQDSKNLSECALALLELGEAALANGEIALGRRALEEARWGLDWMMQARWGDGYVHCLRINGCWSQNIIGDSDDLEALAENLPHNNLLSAGVFARAAVVLRNEDPRYAALCEKYAKEDFAFGVDAMHTKTSDPGGVIPMIVLDAHAALSAIEIYLMNREKQYLEQAVYFTEMVMKCQQTSVPEGFALPVQGYFYEDETHARCLAFFHRSYEHVPIRAVVKLLQAAPDHPRAVAWRNCIDLYADYLKTISKVTPYGLFPAAIYELDNVDLSDIYQEGGQQEGAPSLEEYNAEVRNGVQLDATHYLRRFPVAYQFRGFHAPIQCKAMAALEIVKITGDKELKDIAVRQMEWILGYNPFASSTVYGEGYHYHPLYAGIEPQIVGAAPVGIECYKDEDEPYYPVQNLPTYKEIWVHSTCRLIRLIAYLGF